MMKAALCHKYGILVLSVFTITSWILYLLLLKGQKEMHPFSSVFTMSLLEKQNSIHTSFIFCNFIVLGSGSKPCPKS